MRDVAGHRAYRAQEQAFRDDPLASDLLLAVTCEASRPVLGPCGLQFYILL